MDFLLPEPRKNGAEIIAKNSSGQLLKSSGETDEEAYKRMIDLIEHTLDERSN